LAAISVLFVAISPAFLAIAVGTIGFSALSLYSISTGGKPLATDSVAPLSILTIIGGVMFGIIDFYKSCKKSGIKPIIGCCSMLFCYR